MNISIQLSGFITWLYVIWIIIFINTPWFSTWAVVVWKRPFRFSSTWLTRYVSLGNTSITTSGPLYFFCVLVGSLVCFRSCNYYFSWLFRYCMASFLLIIILQLLLLLFNFVACLLMKFLRVSLLFFIYIWNLSKYSFIKCRNVTM